MAMPIGEWTRGPAIGRGSSATVSLAVDRRTGAAFAVKSVDDAARVGELRREQSILLGLTSPHVVRCLGVSGCDLFLEYASSGSLADEIKRRGGRCKECLIRSRARDVLCGLAHVHAAGVAHCDLKARNVLIGANGRAMIADFGCARRVAAGHRGGDKMRGGTPMFMAPEAARGEEQGTAADIWALGCTVVEMATGGAPWPRFADPMAALRHIALSGEVPECPQWMSEDAKDFLARCFRRDPRERWTAEQLLQHQFVATADSDAAEKETSVSPKSVLDQAPWDDSTACIAADATTAAPTDRVRELAASAPEWTWDASWITVHSDDVRSTSTLPEAETSSHSLAPSSATAIVSGHHPTAAEEAVNLTTRTSSHGHGNSYGDAISSRSVKSTDDDTFCGGDHVVSDCNDLAITSNGFFHSEKSRVSFAVGSCPSLRFACSFFSFSLNLFPSKLQPTLCDCNLTAWQLGGGHYASPDVRTRAAETGEFISRAVRGGSTMKCRSTGR